ncbi:MAG: iron transporter [Lachnospiraceae bacterium]|nr:iron transporter [Lachnospiraceae bacterium]
MKKKLIYLIVMIFSASLLFGCDKNNEATVVDNEVTVIEPVEEDLPAEGDNEESNINIDTCELEDGVYLADFNTDSSMFHVNEMCDGKGELTVSGGKMTIHISLPSKSILNLYSGLAEDAAKDGATLLEPTVDTIDYNDGTTEDVHGFDIPVPYLDDEFDVALIGTKGKWYDHKVSVSNPVLKTEEKDSSDTNESEKNTANVDYTVELSLEGGTGKATISSPASVKKTDEGYILVIEWSSPNYDYMIVDGVKYLPVNTEGNSVFEIPVKSLDASINVIADTVAMSKPHEIEYKIIINSDSIKENK